MAYDSDTAKIDSLAVNGLSGVANSLAYKVANIERAIQSGARWFGAAVTPDGEDHVADRIGPSVAAFQLDAGDNDWGSWVQILGATDTPTEVGKAYFGPHFMTITAAQETKVYFIQFCRGTSGAAGYTAGTYTEQAFDLTTKAGGTIVPIQTGRAPAGSKLWARCLVPSTNTGTIDFYLGIREYEG